MLRDEISPYYTKGGDVSHQHLQYLEHLNGVINETLRLHPPVPTALPRITPLDGIEIGDVYIPGNTTVWCPQYVIGRSKFPYLCSISAQRNPLISHNLQAKKCTPTHENSSRNAGTLTRISSRRGRLSHPSP